MPECHPFSGVIFWFAGGFYVDLCRSFICACWAVLASMDIPGLMDFE